MVAGIVRGYMLVVGAGGGRRVYATARGDLLIPASASITSTAIPACASSRETKRPTGPAPITHTVGSDEAVLELEYVGFVWGYGKQRRAYVILTVLLTDSWWYV